MENQRITIFDRNLVVKFYCQGRTEQINQDIIERSITKFTLIYEKDNTENILVDSDFIHDNQSQYFGIITRADFKDGIIELETTSNQYIFNSDIILPSQAQAGNTATIKSYLDTFLNKYLTNVFQNARLPLMINNQVPTSLTFTLPQEARNVNFSNWFNRYVRLYNLELKTSLFNDGVNRKIKVDIVIVPFAETIYIDDLRSFIISSDINLTTQIKNIINVIDQTNTTQKTTFYLKQDGNLTTNANDTTILSGINETTILISDYSTAKATEEANKLVENTFKNEIKLIVEKEYYDKLRLNQKAIFVTKNRLQINTRLTKKISEKGIFTLVFGDERNNLASVINKLYKKEDTNGYI